ncbi:Protein of unknown function [Bacillus thuringiensis]|uniref:Uncharacterized protein n=1 Tax=Bacillus thuringiensis TaxID=1428 RepID=A0A1C4EMP1_BACTU|nr:Protein of unknown function [Bacillus thuringiensis]
MNTREVIPNAIKKDSITY